MISAADPIDTYLSRLQEKAATEGPVKRFFLFLDDDLAPLEDELSASGRSGEFYDRLLALMRQWKAEMSESGWQEVLSLNASLNGANQNWLLDEV